MKYIKLFESSKKSIFDKLSLSKEDITNILSDLIDLEYEINLDEVYITEDGLIHRSDFGLADNYPTISIGIHKNMNGSKLNWDGSIFYDDRQDHLDAIYHTVSRLRSMLKDEAKVYLSIRNQENISIRIVLNKESGIGVQYKDINSTLINIIKDINEKSRTIDASNTNNFYKIKVLDKGLKSTEISISNKLNTGKLDLDNPSGPADFMINKMIIDNENSNINQINSVFGNLLRNFIREITKKYPNIKIRTYSDDFKHPVRFRSNSIELYDKYTNFVYSKIHISDVFIVINTSLPYGKKPLFGSKKMANISIYGMEIILTNNI